jgi:DNA-binding IclR family transcriptional regulator
MGTDNKSSGSLKTVVKFFEIVETIEQLEEAKLTEIAEHMDLAVSTVHEYLKTLEELEYVDREDGQYRLGLKFLRLGTNAKRNVELDSKVRPYLQRLADETGETVWFLVEEHGLAVYLEHVDGEQAIETSHQAGRRSHLHCHAGGKAILAHLPHNHVKEILDRRGLPRMSENTITSREELFTALERIRKRGYAQNDNENIMGTRSVSAPIVVEEEVMGAISIGGPETRLLGSWFEEELPNQVMNAANEIRLEVLYS